jgi:hypothetical protein
VIVASLLVPTAVSAAVTTQLVSIVGASKNKADVTGASQLLTTEAAPSSFVEYSGLNEPSGNTCDNIVTIPTGKGFIARNIEASPVAFNAESIALKFFTGPTCSGTQFATMVLSAGSGTVSFPQSFGLNPGFAFATGSTISVEAGTSGPFDVYVQGYTVPSSDVPGTTR